MPQNDSTLVSSTPRVFRARPPRSPCTHASRGFFITSRLPIHTIIFQGIAAYRAGCDPLQIMLFQSARETRAACLCACMYQLRRVESSSFRAACRREDKQLSLSKHPWWHQCWNSSKRNPEGVLDTAMLPMEVNLKGRSWVKRSRSELGPGGALGADCTHLNTLLATIIRLSEAVSGSRISPRSSHRLGMPIRRRPGTPHAEASALLDG